MPRLPVFRAGKAGAEGPLRRPLFASAAGDERDYLVARYSSLPHGAVDSSSEDGRLAVHLEGGPVGKIGDADLFFGTLTERALNLVRRDHDAVNELLTAISIPCEAIVADLFLHRSIRGLDSLRASIHGTLSGPLPQDEQLREVVRLPIACGPALIEDIVPALDIPYVPRYGELVADALRALRSDPRDFLLFRTHLEFPPVPSALLTRWDLPQA